MLDRIWVGMIVISMIVAICNGQMADMGTALIDASGEAITLGISLLGIISLWTGLIRIGEDAGLMKRLGRALTPFLHWLFPSIPAHHAALEHMATNIIANFIGLGWAATPPGLQAMQSLQELNPHPKQATRDMCTFMILNMSSLQLIPNNMIAYRIQYGSANPTEIVAPAILATSVSTLVGILYAKLRYRHSQP